ncbi:PfkB family carbohydrate kinase [Aestuariivirga sp.]|uniref:PfkB family carbohydrate kinase n=1 Tax=Aestuariivirga sp. TaxID=2650926 RepID=UPI00359381CA
MPEFEFAAVGDNCVDRFLPPADECLVGGNALNVAVQLAMLGRKVHYFGAVGDDAAGRAVTEALAEQGVLATGLRTLQGFRTAYTDIEMTEDGDRSFVFEEFGACAAYRAAPEDISLLKGMRHIHIGWLGDGGALRRALRGQGPTLSQDLSVNNTPENLSAEGLDVAFCSADPDHAESEARRLLEQGARLAVVTMGAAGSFLSDGRRKLTASAAPVTPEDTTGAGDAFIAGFIDAQASGADLEHCMAHGAARAAAACLHRGGFPQRPLKALAQKFDPQGEDPLGDRPDLM